MLGRIKIFVDIDDSLADYTQTFLNFIDREGLGKFQSIDVVKEQLGPVVYEYVKETYRLSGIKRDLPPLFNKEHMRSIHYQLMRFEAEIVVLTSRPIETYQSIYRDTFIWLAENRIPFSGIKSGRDKCAAVSNALARDRNWVACYAIEDDPKYACDLAAVCKKVMLIDLDGTKITTCSNESAIIKVRNIDDAFDGIIYLLGEEKVL